MGFLRKLLGLQDSDFSPNLSMSEYDNWLNFVSDGGSSEQWEKLKSANKWKFAEDDTEKFTKYQKEVRPISDRYFFLMEKIQKDWSALYNSKNYQSRRADRMEKDCLTDIAYYEEMRRIELKYGENPPENIPALRRLAMLYERQGRLEESVAICKKACAYGMNECARMKKLLKRAGRGLNPDEILLINKFSTNE